MSWKLTKKLKDTHLSPLSNPFSSRSSSTSTITDTTQKPNASTDSVPQMQQPPAPRPGTLVIALHEGKGLSLPQTFYNSPTSQGHHSVLGGGGFSVAGSTRPTSSSARIQQPVSASYSHSQGPLQASPAPNRQPTARFLPYALVDFDKNQIFVSAVSGTASEPLWAGDSTQYKFDVSRPGDITVQIYVRNPNSPPAAGRNEDVFLGACRITPRFEHAKSLLEDPKASKKDKDKPSAGFPLPQQGVSGKIWVDLALGSGAIRLSVDYVESPAKPMSMDDFELLKVVGKGSFGKVLQVRKRDTHRIYALKSIRKQHIISRSEVAHTLAERSVLAQINNPFIVPLKFSFQSPDKLYLVLAFVNGGELFHHLQREGRFDINRSRFYTAELLCALECLHGFNVIYRDLKPENILLDYTGHIALCDFGLCKLDMKDGEKTSTFCGTPEYLAPELLLGNGYDRTVDYWTLGILLYEMLVGLPPYYDENTNEMYRKILQEPLSFPSSDIVPHAAKDLLTRLLDRDPSKRLGAKGAAEIKAHHFFNQIDWRKLLQKKYEPTFKPNVMDALDTANFDREFTSELPADSLVDGPLLSSTVQQQFAGWSYSQPTGLGNANGSVRDPSFGSVQ